MHIVEIAVRKVKRVLRITTLLYSLVNSALVFLGFSVLLKFFSLPFMYALLPALFAFVFVYRQKYKHLGFGDVEKKIPELEWRLRTSIDNRERSDELASSLHRDVMEKIGLVKLSRFLQSRGMLYRFSAILCLALLLMFIQTQGITFKKAQSAFTGNPWIDTLTQQKTELNKYLENTEEAGEDLYGEKSIPNYGDKEELLELAQMKGLVDVNNYDENGEGKTFTTQSTGAAGEAVGSGNSQEKISEENKNIVENYFRKINEK